MFCKKQLGAVHVVAGHDYHFGYKGQGDVTCLQTWCASHGIGCDIIGRVELHDITVSSTHIRNLIQHGKMAEAVEFLGHPHILSGEVVHGKQLGRTIGVPTANLILPPQVLVPAYGVYATRVHLRAGTYLAVTNVGVRPTVDTSQQVTVEPWILDYSGHLYGQHIAVEFYTLLRGERKFSTLDELKVEILHNAEQTRSFFAAHG